jgi:hypothetical protein
MGEQLGMTHEMFITSEKTHVQLVRIGLHLVTYPLLFRLRPPFELKNAGLQQQTITDLYCGKRQDSGNLSSYEEIWSAQLVVGKYACASRLHRRDQRGQEKLAPTWSGSAGCVGSGAWRRWIGGPDWCSTATN